VSLLNTPLENATTDQTGSIANLGNGKGVMVSNVAAYQGVGDLYNTLITVTAHASGPTFERTVTKLFYGNEILYGSWSNIVSPHDGNLLMVGRTEVGLFLARVKPAEMTDRTKVFIAPPSPLSPV
jgi:hypothetical protein